MVVVGIGAVVGEGEGEVKVLARQGRWKVAWQVGVVQRRKERWFCVLWEVSEGVTGRKRPYGREEGAGAEMTGVGGG